MIEIIPAILEQDLNAIKEKLQKVIGAASVVQIDVDDGFFGAHTTWPYATAAQRTEFEEIFSQQKGFPLWEDFDFEIDLMVSEAEQVARMWISAGASRIVIHRESKDAKAALERLQEFRNAGNSFPLELGLAVPSYATVDMVSPFEGLYDYVQVMGIEKIGFQKQPFDPRALVCISKLRKWKQDLVLQVDGGVHMQNVRALVQAGAQRLLAGSAVFSSVSPSQALDDMRQEAQASV